MFFEKAVSVFIEYFVGDDLAVLGLDHFVQIRNTLYSIDSAWHACSVKVGTDAKNTFAAKRQVMINMFHYIVCGARTFFKVGQMV